MLRDPASHSKPAYTIRRALPDDAASLAELGRDTFVATFGHLYPPDDLRVFLEETYTPQAFAEALVDAASALWVAEADGRPVGYAQVGPCKLPHADVTPGCGEIKRLYLRRELQNAGIGGALLAHALEWLQAPGRQLWIGVWSRNLGAQRLYGRHGFEKVGEYEFPVGNTRDQEFILRRAAPLPSL
jgi:ribosomal protein S18 acetylase RimI-like enzyme